MEKFFQRNQCEINLETKEGLNMEKPIEDYLGDAVYAKFNEYGQIELRVNDHRNPNCIVLEPEVLDALNRFSVRCWQEKEKV